MGWFLFKSKATKPRKRSTVKAVQREPWDPGRTLLALKVVGSVAAVVLLAIGWVRGQEVLGRYVASHHQQAVPRPVIELVDRPAWMSDAIAQDVRYAVAGEVTGDPLDHAGLQRAAEALLLCPWVQGEAVQDVRIERHGAAVHVAARYREPAALVMAPTRDDRLRMLEGRPLMTDGDVFHLVDRDGVRLPPSYRGDEAAVLGLPRVVRVRQPAPAVGQPWAGEDVRGAIELARYIGGDPYFEQVKAIDAFEQDASGRLQLVLRTDLTRPSGAVWGPPPGSERPYDTDPQTKRLRLLNVYNDGRGSIDRGGKLVEVHGAATLVRHLQSR